MNSLQYRQEFAAILKDYQISEEGKRLLKQIKLAVMTGPTAAGRNTIIAKLVDTGRYEFIVSDTTRQPRINNGVLEQNGKVYWFKSEIEFLDGLKRGNYLEAEIIHNQQVSGISLAELKRIQQKGLVGINEVDVYGIKNILKLKPDTVGIYIIPPSFNIWFERIINRGKLPKLELVHRLNTAVDIFNDAAETKDCKVIINDDLNRVTAQADVLIAGKSRIDDRAARGLAKTLAKQTREYLRSVE